jgi:hypothetical protein
VRCLRGSLIKLLEKRRDLIYSLYEWKLCWMLCSILRPSFYFNTYLYTIEQLDSNTSQKWSFICLVKGTIHSRTCLSFPVRQERETGKWSRDHTEHGRDHPKQQKIEILSWRKNERNTRILPAMEFMVIPVICCRTFTGTFRILQNRKVHKHYSSFSSGLVLQNLISTAFCWGYRYPF